MFNQLLVTPTLLDSFEFAKNAPPKWRSRAMKDFVAKIKREPVSYPTWVSKGQEFEDDVYKACKLKSLTGEEFEGSDLFKQVVKHCYGGTFQNKLKRIMTIGEDQAIYFGFSDVEFPEKTLDLKTTVNYKGADKYRNKWQHKLYLWMNHKKQFEYVIAVWKSEHEYKLVDVKTIPITIEDKVKLERDIKLVTLELFEFIRANDLWQDYYFTFSKN